MQGIAPSNDACDTSDPAVDDWSALLALVPDGVLETEDGTVVRANVQAASLLGAEGEPSALVGRELGELLEPRGDGALLRTAREVVPCRVLGLHCERHVNLRSQNVARARALHVLVDAHKYERANATLLETARDLGAARSETSSLRRAYGEAIAERRELVNIVCHELRTPITVIRGYAKLLLSDEVGSLNDEQRRFIEESAKSCNRLDDFVELLLRASNEERVSMDELVEIEAPLAPVLEGVVAYLRPLLEERRVQVELELAPDALWARFDAARIEQVVANLVSNAVEYAGPGGKLRIHARRLAVDWVEIGVSDEGPGVPDQERARIFEPYARGAAVTCERGLGLGLAICRRIVEAHGGRIEVRAAREAPDGDTRGSCFAFTLSAAQAKPASCDADQEG